MNSSTKTSQLSRACLAEYSWAAFVKLFYSSTCALLNASQAMIRKKIVYVVAKAIDLEAISEIGSVYARFVLFLAGRL